MLQRFVQNTEACGQKLQFNKYLSVNRRNKNEIGSGNSSGDYFIGIGELSCSQIYSKI